ncbi:MAG: BamA/TamA family outer membrane protein [Gammaproteobacteria bacterium]
MIARHLKKVALGAVALLGCHAVKADDGGILPDVRARTTHERLDRPVGVPSDAELESAHARIGTVTILAHNIFDTARPEENTSLFRLANELHLRTHAATVRSQLLFAEGARYDGRLLQESERILRTTRYLQDANIRPVAWHDGLVDVEVITHDVWTLNPGVSFGRKGGKNSTGVGIEELNFLGLGKQLSFERKSNVDRTSTALRYVDPQLLSSWWRLTAGYSDNSDGRTKEFDLEHPFYALDTRWATGFTGKTDERVDSLYNLGKIRDQFGVAEKNGTIYGGWSRGLRDGWTTRLTYGATYDESRFHSVIGETGPTQLVPADRKLVYPWLGYEWIQDEYEKTRNRDQIEKTEDFLLGLHAHTQLGYATTSLGSDRNAWMFDAGLSRGFAPGSRHRILLSSTVTGRHDSTGFADVRSEVAARYYFRQSDRRLLFLSATVDAASNLDPDHQILLGGENGLRGYPLRYQAGEGSWLVTAEQRFFTNWYPFRLFNVGGAIFTDIGRTWGGNTGGTPSRGLSLGVLKDVGFGLRFGNSRSALGNVLHVDVAVPLDGGSDIQKVQFLVSTQRSF